MEPTPQKHMPWVEKYRPTDMDNIVLEEYNKDILNNIVDSGLFPNVLFYGPPGTGKTTTIINLIKKFQEKHGQYGKEVVIHLNASDDRGIDIIRNQIHSFVNSYNLFGKGLKFVILDEVDYMTKTAQQALKSLITQNNKNIRYCLICNYVSKIDRSLQEEFITFRFNQLPKDNIICFLSKIVKNEKLKIRREKLEAIQYYFDSDIRSMINYIQANQDNIRNMKLVNHVVFDKITDKIKSFYIHPIHHKKNNSKEITFYNFVYELSNTYGIEVKELVKKYIYYFYHKYAIGNSSFLNKIEFLIHSECNDKYYILYLLHVIYSFFSLHLS